MSSERRFDTPNVRAFIDDAMSSGTLNESVGELIYVLRSLVAVIDVHYKNDHFTALSRAKALLERVDVGSGSALSVPAVESGVGGSHR